MPDRFSSSPSDYLAAERTFLAWIRTGLALMGFGFVVSRFGLFLAALRVGTADLPQTYGLSFWFGTALILLGVIVNVVCAWSHIRPIGELNRGEFSRTGPSRGGIIVALVLAVLGLAMAGYLITVREPPKQAGAERLLERSMTSNSNHGIVTIPGHLTVDQTVQKLEAILEAKGVKLFTLVDHSGEAEKAGMQMRPTKLLIFGNPKAGTPLMIAAPGIAIDLPLKVLVWEGGDGKVWVSYNDPAYLQARHGLPPELVQNIAVVETLAKKAAE